MTLNPNDDPASSPPAAMGRMEDEPRSAPAHVYRADEVWIVEPPRDMASTIDKTIFTGSQAQKLALTYAFERFGNARFFPY